MERKDLLGINGKIFTSQGEAIARMLLRMFASSSSAILAIRIASSP